MPRGQVKASADVFVGCSSQFLKLPWKPSPREIINGMLRLTFDSPKSFAEQMNVVLETMHDRSTQWYPRWTPAASLAIGYVNQFIEPFVTKCVDTRRAAREDKDFVLEV